MCFSPKPAIITKEWVPANKTILKPHWQQTLKFLDYSIYEKYKSRENFIYIPCGKCLACRISKANDWATRCYLEAKQWKYNCFVTLSYNNENLPYFKSLNRRDLQLFMKKLRKNHKGFEPRMWKGKVEYPIRFFACGEYGDKTLRPHYHLGIFNWQPQDLVLHKLNKLQQPLYRSKTIENLWGKGFIIVGPLTMESSAYIARYTQKKIYQKHDQIIKDLGRDKEFIVTSRRGGLGFNILNDEEEFKKMRNNFGILLKQNGQVKLKNIPEAIRIKWRLLDDLDYICHAENRRKTMKIEQDKINNKISQHDIQRFDTEAKMKEETLKKLRRETF